MKGLRERLLENATPSPRVHASYQSVLDSVDSVIYTVDRKLCITGVNRAWDDFARANGGEQLTSEHILGTHLLDQMDGPPRERWRTACQQILDGEIPRYVHEVASTEPYAWRHYSLIASPLCNSQGEILGITFVASNITQLKKAEHEMFQRLIEIRGLRQVAHTTRTWSERRKVYKQVTADIAHLFGADKCVIFLWDEETGNLQAQDPAFGLSGRKLVDLSLDMGHPADPQSLWPDLEEEDYILLNEGAEAPEDMVETSARVDRLAAMMAVLRVSARIHGTILVAGRDRPFSEQDSQLLAALAIPLALSIENAELHQRLLDRTQQLAATREELDRMVKLKEAIRMPLTVVRGYLELLLEEMLGPIPKGQRPTMRMVLTKTQAITSLINRISPSQFPPDATRYEHIHLGDLMRQVLDKRAADIQKAGVTLTTQLPASQEQGSVTVGDSELLLKVFDALVDNALKFSPHGGALRASLRTSGDIIYVKITDSGVGIPEDQLLKIWKPHQPPTHFGPIELAEVKRIVEGHGGQIWVESTPGEGSTFHVALRKRQRSNNPKA